MSKTNRIEVRVTRAQKEQIASNAYASGYVTISSFLRDRGLEMFADNIQGKPNGRQLSLAEF